VAWRHLLPPSLWGASVGPVPFSWFTWLDAIRLHQRTAPGAWRRCTSLLIAYGVHAKAIQAILGHANIQITLDVYGHLLPNVLRDATDQMDALVPPEEAGEDSKEESEKEE